MENFISTGKLKEGTKIITYGAELLDCDRGFFPLEVLIIIFFIHKATCIFEFYNFISLLFRNPRM